MISYTSHSKWDSSVRRKSLTRITNRFTAASCTQFYLWCFTQRFYNYRFSQLFYKLYSCNIIFTYTFVYSKKRNYTRRGIQLFSPSFMFCIEMEPDLTKLAISRVRNWYNVPPLEFWFHLDRSLWPRQALFLALEGASYILGRFGAKRAVLKIMIYTQKKLFPMKILFHCLEISYIIKGAWSRFEVNIFHN